MRTERESDREKREEKWQACWCCRDQQKACRMVQASAEKLEHTGSAEKERVASVPQREQLARTPELPLPKEKEQSHLFRVPDHEGEKVKVGESCTLARKRGIRARAWRGKGGLHCEGGFQGGKGGQAKRASLEDVEGSMSG